MTKVCMNWLKTSCFSLSVVLLSREDRRLIPSANTVALFVLLLRAVLAMIVLISGYSHKVRQDTLLGLLEREKQMAALPQRYRSRDQIRSQKQESQLRYPNTWFLRGQHTSVLSVQATPGSLLANALRKTLRGCKAPRLLPHQLQAVLLAK